MTLDDVAEIVNLQRAWAVVLANDEADGKLGFGTRRFAEQAHESIPELARELRAGTFAPAPLHAIRIEKDDGDERELHLSAVRDRIVERAIAQLLSPLIDPILSPFSFAFRRGLGVKNALDKLIEARDSGATVCLRSDLSKCFDRLDHGQLIDGLTELSIDPFVVELIKTLIERDVRVNGIGFPVLRGVPQGSPLSPVLCNLFLDRLDRTMAAAGFHMIRFADDLAISCDSQEHAEEALDRLRKVTLAMDLSLNDEKTAIMSFDDGFAFLGEEVSTHYPEAENRLQVPEKRSLFVCRDGVIRIENGQVVVSDDSEELLRVPQTIVGSIVVYGSTGVSAGLRSYALRENVPVTFLSRRGTYLGMLHNGRRPSARLIRQQILATDNEAFVLALVKRIVRGKLANSRALLLRYGNRGESNRAIEAAEALATIREQAADGASVEMVRGSEGAGAAAYWRGFAELIPEGMTFPGRRHRPAPDPVNSALSFGYALLLGEVTGAVIAAGLDPAFGMLHTEQDTRPSLSLDLMEEFRSLIVDTTVLSLFRRDQLNANSFRKDEGAVLLTEKGRRVVIAAFEERMLTVFSHVPSGKKVSYRRALLLQAWQFAASVSTGHATYEAVSWR